MIVYERLGNMYNQYENLITENPAIMGGKPCIRGLRVTVDMIVGALNSGTPRGELLADFPYLQDADLDAARDYVLHKQERL